MIIQHHGQPITPLQGALLGAAGLWLTCSAIGVVICLYALAQP